MRLDSTATGDETSHILNAQIGLLIRPCIKGVTRRDNRRGLERCRAGGCILKFFTLI
jgi:hypothetical protein